MSDPVERQRLEDLIAQWEDSHADWCCTKGCASPAREHFAPDAIHTFLDEIGRGELTPKVPPTVPCEGACSCDVGLYVSSLRAAMEQDQPC